MKVLLSIYLIFCTAAFADNFYATTCTVGNSSASADIKAIERPLNIIPSKMRFEFYNTSGNSLGVFQQQIPGAVLELGQSAKFVFTGQIPADSTACVADASLLVATPWQAFGVNHLAQCVVQNNEYAIVVSPQKPGMRSTSRGYFDVYLLGRDGAIVNKYRAKPISINLKPLFWNRVVRASFNGLGVHACAAVPHDVIEKVSTSSEILISASCSYESSERVQIYILNASKRSLYFRGRLPLTLHGEYNSRIVFKDIDITLPANTETYQYLHESPEWPEGPGRRCSLNQSDVYRLIQ